MSGGLTSYNTTTAVRIQPNNIRFSMSNSVATNLAPGLPQCRKLTVRNRTQQTHAFTSTEDKLKVVNIYTFSLCPSLLRCRDLNPRPPANCPTTLTTVWYPTPKVVILTYLLTYLLYSHLRVYVRKLHCPEKVDPIAII